MNNENKVFKASIIYILVSLVNKGIGIITVPIFTRLLSTSEMGTVTTWISWMTILTPITSMSLTTGSMYIALNEYENKRDQYQSSVLVLSTISSCCCLCIYLILHNILNKLFTLTTPLMFFMFIYLIFSPALDMWMLRQRYEYNTKKMAIVTLFCNVLASLVAVILVLRFQNSGYDLGNLRIYGTYTIMGIFGIGCYIIILKNGKTFFNKTYWKYGLFLSIPLIIHTLAKNILDVSDRSMISLYCGKEAVGIYGTIYSISTLSLIVWSAINNAFVPCLYDNLAKDDEKSTKDIKKISYIMIIFYAIVCLGLTAIAPEIVRILTTEQYYEAVYIIPPTAAGIFLTCVYNLFANVILYHKKSVYVMIATLLAAITNIVLNAIFIPRFGYIAASYTTLVAYILLAVFQGIMFKRIHRRSLYNIKIIFLISLIVILFCLAFNTVYEHTLVRYIIIFILLVGTAINYKKIVKIMKIIKNR